MSGEVTALSITPVKATRLLSVPSVELTEEGARGDRSFYIVDGRGRMVNGKTFGGLHAIVSEYDGEQLTLSFPGGERACAPVRLGQEVSTWFYAPRRAREVVGPWSDALSEHLGQPLRLVADGSAVDRGRQAAITVMSRASLERLAGEGDVESVDGRRFRMLIEVGGVPAHKEDRWIGRRVRIGSALVLMHGHVGRCMVTTRNPDTGEVDLKTLHFLAAYRKDVESDEALPFGVYGEVLEGATVRLGDPVEVMG